jgi:hypothetical protein
VCKLGLVPAQERGRQLRRAEVGRRERSDERRGPNRGVDGSDGSRSTGNGSVGQDDVAGVLKEWLSGTCAGCSRQLLTPRSTSAWSQVLYPGDRVKVDQDGEARGGMLGSATTEVTLLTLAESKFWHGFPPWTCQCIDQNQRTEKRGTRPEKRDTYLAGIDEVPKVRTDFRQWSGGTVASGALGALAGGGVVLVVGHGDVCW